MRYASLLLLSAGSLLLPGCSGGSTDNTSEVRIKCLNGESFCIISCDLGCSQSGCSVSEIAENQQLRFRFSDLVEPSSVNSASISLRTATGVAPDGEYIVQGSEVVFVPRVSTVNGVSTFGFLRNESYIVSIAGGPTRSQGVRSLSGDTLAQELTCTVRASLGIQDQDQQPPTVTLVAPVNTAAVPLDPTVVLRFSELIDTTALQTSLSESSPIRFILRGTLASGECDRDAEGIALEGLPALSTEQVGSRQVTVVTFQPTVQLPSKSCLTVSVSADVRDLSGRAAIPAQFELLTIEGTSTPIQLNEGFLTSEGQVVGVSGGVWSNGARPGLLGGDGRHGVFNPANGTPLGNNVFEWNVNSITIPAGQTETGQAATVTDGRFFFSEFVVPAGTTVRFIGTVGPEIYVRGRVEINGTLQLNGADMPFFVPTAGSAAGQRVSTFNARSLLLNPLPGQPGGAGGAGGGRGGNGGNKCLSAGPIIVNGVNVTNGQNGEPVQVRASHAFAGQTANTAGRGALMHPASGLPVNTPVISPAYRALFAPGGSGGGFVLAGTASTATLLAASIGPAPAASTAFTPLVPVTITAGYTSLEHFSVGGSGGGGGASHSFGTITVSGDQFMAGHGGTGGGGKLVIRSGGDLTVGGTAQLQAKGGTGVLINGDDATTVPHEPQPNWGVSSPGGGGSGGSFLLQSARTVTVSGLIDTSGSAGSRNGSVLPVTLSITSAAGAGSHGFYRLEGGTNVVFGGPATTVPAFNSAVHTGPLVDRDASSGDLSTWRSSGRVFPPTWERYELDVDTDGDGTIDITFTDSGLPGTQKANSPTGPVRIEFQGATLNQAGTEPLEGSVRAWREGIGSGAGIGIQQDSVTGFRFRMIYNRADFPNQAVRALRVFART